ncbi:toxin-antitoxin system YwqK family antitoxin [Actinorugispora endophytica]|uniref:MORN repeat protein n=1 Tax=Actinorugispora endophytica TaxID=1605990 RepID=A0A4R6UY88_9ACTN|nr:hypothetical protein [Actinorugispora endophytica]TDQ52270.1 MORN repeat protein [Actinorugispora endophytica]
MNRISDEELESDGTGIALHEGKPFSGESVDYGPNGQILSLSTYKNGYEEGPWLEWYPDGTPKVEGLVAYSKGAVGPWKKWHPNGLIAEERNFDEEGVLVSERRWSDAGDLVEEKTYNAPRG